MPRGYLRLISWEYPTTYNLPPTTWLHATLLRMQSRLKRALHALELEEKVLNGGIILAMAALFFPWLSGEWLGEGATRYSAFGFFTAYLGFAIFALLLAALLLTIVPLVGGPSMAPAHQKE